MNLNQCVPNWDLEEPPNSNSNRLASHVPIMGKEPRPDGEVTELTWKNGNPSMHGLGHTPVAKPVAVARWQKPQLGSGTLEAVVDQATAWLGGPQKQGGGGRKRARAAAEEESRNCRSQGSRKSVGITDTCHLVSAEDAGGGFTTTSATQSPVEDGGSPETENGSFVGGGGGQDDSACQSKRSLDETGEEEKLTKVETGISSISTKRSRAASVHNQSERKRRDRINEKMRTLQKLVPNSGKTDKASMLDEVIDYLKQLQAQVQMMNRMSSIPPMMMPMSMQQFQISMMAQMAQMVQMAQMGMGMGLGMGMMDLGPLGRPGLAPMAPSIIPTTSAFVPFTGADQSQQFGTQSTVAPDTFLASAQPPGMDAYNRMAALYQQLHQQPPPSNTKP